MAGPSGKQTRIGAKGISNLGGIGSGLGVTNDMKIHDNYKYDTYHTMKSSKSIPKEIFPSQTSSIDADLERLHVDRSDNILQGRDNGKPSYIPRRTVSSSPFGRDTYETRYSGQSSLIDANCESLKRNRHKSPIDDIYKKYNIVQKDQK